jgi:hypothetical protein
VDHKHAYEAVLLHTVQITSPQVFLQLLPDDGKMSFFLPFIEKSVSKLRAKEIRDTLVKTVLELEGEQIR